MRYTIETKCPNEQCNFVLKRLPISNNLKTDMSWMKSLIFRFKCPQCQTFFDVIGKEEIFEEKILIGKGELGTLFGVSVSTSVSSSSSSSSS